MKYSNLCSSTGLRCVLLCAVLGSWGCSQPVQHEVALRVQERPTAQAAVDPIVPVIEAEAESQAWPLIDLPQAQHTSMLSLPMTSPSSPTLTMDEEWLTGVELQTRVFLSKDGALMGDFTLMNTNPVPITEVKIQCAEYDPNQTLLKTTSRVLSAYEWIGPSQQEFFGDIEFDYVDAAFSTVTCRLYSLKASDSTASLKHLHE